MTKNLQAGLRQSMKASKQAGLSSDGVFSRAPLDLRFALQKTLDSRITFTRASTGTFVGSDGLIKTATTNEPRFDHNPTTGESLGLLVEEARTNQVLQSNQFDTTWTNSNTSETAAAGIAPDGTNTAWELKDTADAVSTAHSLVQAQSWTAGVTYTVSCWMKPGTLNEGAILFPGAAFTTAINCRFNLTTGALINASAGVTASSVAFPNGWFRIIATATATTTAAVGNLNIRMANGAISYIGTGTGTILIWGAQVEAGAFATSYIPTTSATVTRAADVASITGSNFSSFYNQTEGTVFADVNIPTGAIGVVWDIGAGGIFGTTEFLNKNAATTIALAPNNAPINVSSTVNAGYVLKTASALKLNNSVLAANNTLGAVDTSCAVPDAPTTLTIGKGGWVVATNYSNGTIKRLTYWPTRLANTVLQQITQS